MSMKSGREAGWSAHSPTVRWWRDIRRPALALFGAVCWVGGGAACVEPTPRLVHYLGPTASETGSPGPEQVPRPLDVGLVLVNDTEASGSAPSLSPDSLAHLARWVQRALERESDLRVIKILDGAKIRPTQDRGQFARIVEEHSLRHLLVVVLSGVESEAPATLSLGGPESVGVPGYEVKHFALVELAVLEGRTGATLLLMQGHGWATLEALTVPVRSNQYPVVRRSIHQAPIFPQEANARDVLRGVAAADAFEQVLGMLPAAWSRVGSGMPRS